MSELQEWIGAGSLVFKGVLIAVLILGVLICFLGYRVRKLLFSIMAVGIGMVAGFQFSRVAFANVWLCLAIGVVCAVLLCILAFWFYRAGVFLTCAALMFLIMQTLLHQETWWVYLAAALAALASGFAAVCFEKQMLARVSGFFGAYMAAAAGFALAGLEKGNFFSIILLAAGIFGSALQIFQEKRKKENETEKIPDVRPKKGKNKKESRKHPEKRKSDEQRERHERRRQSRA